MEKEKEREKERTVRKFGRKNTGGENSERVEYNQGRQKKQRKPSQFFKTIRDIDTDTDEPEINL